MKVIESTKSVFFDVDDTLVIWQFDDDEKNLAIDFGVRPGITEMAVPNEYHIKLLKEFAARGHTVVVWSAGGWEWAKHVVEVLGLEKYVDLVMSKPDWYIDDKPANYFMGNPIYLCRKTGKKLTGNKWDIEL